MEVTAALTGYLAGMTAGRCGPCLNGLPALAEAVAALAAGGPAGDQPAAGELTALLRGRGACAHPDGTVRLVASLLDAFPEEVRTHELGGCSLRPAVLTR